MGWMLFFWKSARTGCALSLALTCVSAGLTLHAAARMGLGSIAAALTHLTVGRGATTWYARRLSKKEPSAAMANRHRAVKICPAR